MSNMSLRIAALAVLTIAVSSALAADRLRIAVQNTGTLAWDLEIIKARGLDRQADLAIEATELANTEAGKIALKGGSADMIRVGLVVGRRASARSATISSSTRIRARSAR